MPNGTGGASECFGCPASSWATTGEGRGGHGIRGNEFFPDGSAGLGMKTIGRMLAVGVGYVEEKRLSVKILAPNGSKNRTEM